MVLTLHRLLNFFLAGVLLWVFLLPCMCMNAWALAEMEAGI